MNTVEFYGQAFFDEMRAGREASRRLGDVIHEVIGGSVTAWDLGAGVGIQTGRLQELGWTIWGGDFAPLAIEQREPGVDVLPFDLSLPQDEHGPVDCVICTEVAEHVPEEHSDQVVKNIATLARKFIVWSAAPPGQGGTGHINCQPPEFWLDRFKSLNWVPSSARTIKLRELMRATEAQHHPYADSFFVLVPIDNTEEFYAFMKSCRDNYRLLADCIHEVVGVQTTALDIGCGVGLQTARLKEHGWSVSGAEFAPVAIEMRESGVDIEPFDLTKPNGGQGAPREQVSCVICTETAEHIPHHFADDIVANIVAIATDVIVWSAACPWQVEPYHINLQPPAYWLSRFNQRGWVVEPQRSARLQSLMLERQAQHYLGRENFFVLVPARPLHFTIVSTVFNAEKWVGKCIESVRRQTFRNYHHIVVNARSDDHTGSVADNEALDDPQLTVIHNEIRQEALENCWAIWKDLPDDEVIIWLDGDDWLAHDEALAVIANAYYDPNVWLTYGQFMFSDGEVGFAAPYPPGVNARYMDWRATHLKTFRAGLVKRLGDVMADGIAPPPCLARPNGAGVYLAIDKAVMWPLLEMAGEHYRCIYQVVSVYNFQASWAMARKPEARQVELDEAERIRALPPFQPLKKRPW